MSDRNRRTGQIPPYPPGLLLRAFDCDGLYVLGFPVHVAVTVHCEHPGTCVRWLPHASWAGNAGAIGVDLVEPETGEELVRVEPWPLAIADLGTSLFTLPPRGCRRMLVDVSSYLPADLAPGYYDL